MPRKTWRANGTTKGPVKRNHEVCLTRLEAGEALGGEKLKILKLFWFRIEDGKELVTAYHRDRDASSGRARFDQDKLVEQGYVKDDGKIKWIPFLP